VHCVAIAKRDCESCRMVAPVLAHLRARAPLELYSRDDPVFPQETGGAVLGNPDQYTSCFAKDQHDPGWTPLNVARGSLPGASTVTLFHGDGVQAAVCWQSRTPATAPGSRRSSAAGARSATGARCESSRRRSEHETGTLRDARSHRGALAVSRPHVLLFDVFGTVVDWRGALIEDLRAFARARGLEADWPAFVDAWKAGYRPGMDAVREGRRAWANVETLYRERLHAIGADFGLQHLDADSGTALVRLWRRSRPWPDAVPGLARLKRDFVLSTLSNGDVAMLVEMARRGGLPWDCVLCAELFRAYKPDPKVYLGAVELLAERPGEVMLVACHNYDLRAARGHGLRTAFIRGRKEFGAGQRHEQEPEAHWDLVADDLEHLATQLGS